MVAPRDPSHSTASNARHMSGAAAANNALSRHIRIDRSSSPTTNRSHSSCSPVHVCSHGFTSRPQSKPTQKTQPAPLRAGPQLRIVESSHFLLQNRLDVRVVIPLRGRIARPQPVRPEPAVGHPPIRRCIPAFLGGPLVLACLARHFLISTHRTGTVVSVPPLCQLHGAKYCSQIPNAQITPTPRIAPIVSSFITEPHFAPGGAASF